MNKLLGAIIGNICGSSYEMDKKLCKKMKSINPKEIQLIRAESDFTDDTICTIAIADAILHDRLYSESLIDWCGAYDSKGCSPMFKKWVSSDFPKPYGSVGNGSAMRVSPVAWIHTDLADCVTAAINTCLCTHNSEEGMEGAAAIAAAIWLADNSYDKDWIRMSVLNHYYPNFLGKKLDHIRPSYSFDATCQGSVPQAILCFLESENYEHCLQLAISLGGDSDTIACMAGGIANAFYDSIPEDLLDLAYRVLPDEMLEIIEEFEL